MLVEMVAGAAQAAMWAAATEVMVAATPGVRSPRRGAEAREVCKIAAKTPSGLAEQTRRSGPASLSPGSPPLWNR